MTRAAARLHVVAYGGLTIFAWACAPARRESADGIVPVAINPRVVERRETDHYEIRGKTLAELSREIGREGPISRGRKFAGKHSSRFRYTYKSVERAGACSPQTRVELHSITTLPRWKDSASADAATQAAWGAYIANLRLHEDNHRLIAFRFASDFERGMRDLKVPVCSMLGGEVRKLADIRFAEAQRAQEEYDAKTQHGRTEGASLRQYMAPGRPRPDTLTARD